MSYKTDLVFWDGFWKEKTLSFNQRNTVIIQDFYAVYMSLKFAVKVYAPSLIPKNLTFFTEF